MDIRSIIPIAYIYNYSFRHFCSALRHDILDVNISKTNILKNSTIKNALPLIIISDRLETTILTHM
jgi:hypothetical protein